MSRFASPYDRRYERALARTGGNRQRAARRAQMLEVEFSNVRLNLPPNAYYSGWHGEPVISLREMADILADHDFWADQKAKVLARVEPLFRRIFDEGMDFALTIEVDRHEGARDSGARDLLARLPLLGRRDFLDPDPEALADAAGQAFRAFTNNWWSQLEEVTRERLRRAIADAALNGTGSKGVIKAIRPLFGAERAKRIGVTETTRLFGRGALASYQASGVTMWQWYTVSDDRVCAICQSRSGKRYPIEDEFDPAHVLCRCFPAPATAALRTRSTRR